MDPDDGTTNLKELLWSLSLDDEPSKIFNSYTKADGELTIATVDNLGVLVPQSGTSLDHVYFQLPAPSVKCVSIRIHPEWGSEGIGDHVGIVVRGDVAQLVDIPKGSVLDEVKSEDGLSWEDGKWHPFEKSVFGMSTKVG